MSPQRLLECLVAIRWSPEVLADALSCDESYVNAMILGEADIPPKIAAWIETLRTFHEVAEAEKPTSLRGKRFRRDVG